jgi:tricorn protease
VELTLAKSAKGDGSHTTTYHPIRQEDDLVYFTWVQGNRHRVDSATGGKIAYLHIPDMGSNGIREFIKWYYPQLRKQGMIVDVRANGGGNVSQMLIERLQLTVLATEFSRTDSGTGVYPSAAFLGPKVAMLDERSSSDGDIFPAMFKAAKIGPLIGKRSWGGVVGISDHGQLIDGGNVNVPESATASAKGEWIIEGYGVDPDIEVENDPAALIAGRDPQLERAISEVMSMLKTNPGLLPKRPADRVKTH